MILTACSLSVRAQDPIAIPFTSTEIYLPVTTYFVKQASDGLIWFSTDAGVFSYNGYNITNYSSANGLSDNEIFRIYEDNKHRLWFLGLNGKCSYYYNGEIFNEENDPMLQKLRFNTMISAETEDRDGNLYIASREGQIYRITPDNQVTMTENENGVFFLYAFRDTVLNIPQYFNKKIGRLPRGGQMGDLVIASIEREIYVLNRDNSFTLITTLPEESQEIIFLGVKADSTIYAGTRNGLYQVSVPDGKILSVNFRGLSITSVTTDDDGQLWLSTLDKGLFLVPSLYNDVYNLSSGWPGNRIFSIYKDKQDSLFISMPGNWYSVIAPDSSFQ
ncbi:MAG TPA: two-component regulator propeller domain-containing protein, partial [Chitinophagales bacterium]|nr:two-component regulator propeller domain-containing protein [Chitinophagales bacterium]